MGSKIVFEGEKEINYVCGELKLKDKIGLGDITRVTQKITL